ncbi:MAG: hypothetical protein HOV81_08495 [Kofleriaceae bacterium]|nr:hypothetical protein [Kofleriaceae bacterium]
MLVVPARRERYAAQLRHPKNRQKFLARLPHFRDWDEPVVHTIPGAEQNVGAIVRRLRALGAGDECWVVSPSKRWDARAMPLVEAITNIVGENDGSIVSCVPGVLAYYEGEELGMRLVLHRRQQ